jgi:Flp pilus assembly pilin Flp
MQKALKAFKGNRSGATAPEYGIGLLVILVIILMVVGTMSKSMKLQAEHRQPTIVELLPDGTCPKGYVVASVARSIDTRDTTQVKPRDVCAK